eukprot:g38143.t1
MMTVTQRKQKQRQTSNLLGSGDLVKGVERRPCFFDYQWAPCHQRFFASDEDLIEQVKAQYDSPAAMTFYRVVMGGGDGNIHYGLVLKPDDTVSSMAQNAVDFLANLLNVAMQGNLKQGTHLLDLGSGHGGAGISNAKRFGCTVVGFNLCSHQNAHAEKEAAKHGVGHLFSTQTGNFDDGLPAAWTEQYDAVWSEEVFCHSQDKAKLMIEVNRVLKPGGALVFSDLMAGDDATAEDLKTFTDRNATTIMYRPKDYLKALRLANFGGIGYIDLTHHLGPFCQGMINRIDENLQYMKQQGVDEHYALTFRQSLTDRLEAIKCGAFAWGAFSGIKLGVADSKVASVNLGAVKSHKMSGRTFSTRRHILPSKTAATSRLHTCSLRHTRTQMMYSPLPLTQHARESGPDHLPH